jgi:hypothetical protein
LSFCASTDMNWLFPIDVYATIEPENILSRQSLDNQHECMHEERNISPGT